MDLLQAIGFVGKVAVLDPWESTKLVHVPEGLQRQAIRGPAPDDWLR